jgi:hypothetical protein
MSKIARYGSSKPRLIVCGSGRSIFLMRVADPRICEPTAGSRIRVTLNSMSSLVRSRPLWNFTPWRSFRVRVRASALHSQRSASTGWGCRFLS